MLPCWRLPALDVHACLPDYAGYFVCAEGLRSAEPSVEVESEIYNDEEDLEDYDLLDIERIEAE